MPQYGLPTGEVRREMPKSGRAGGTEAQPETSTSVRSSIAHQSPVPRPALYGAPKSHGWIDIAHTGRSRSSTGLDEVYNRAQHVLSQEREAKRPE